MLVLALAPALVLAGASAITGARTGSGTGKFVSDRLTDSGRLVAVIPSGAKWVCSLVQENIKKSSICSSRSANSASSASGTSTTSSHSSTSTVVPDQLASLSTGLKKGR